MTLSLERLAAELIAADGQQSETMVLRPGERVSIAGVAGPQGETGPQGERGETGPQGEQGVDGDIGPVGPQGIAGDPGRDGKDGRDGATGDRGPKGVKGDDGKDGTAGPKGDKGDPGPPGPQGGIFRGRSAPGAAGGGLGVYLQDEAVPLNGGNVIGILDFEGAGVTATIDGQKAVITIPGGGGGGAVASVNGQTGVVVLTASDVGAIPQGGPLTEDLYTGGFNVGGEEDGAATGSYLQTQDAVSPNGGSVTVKGGLGDAGGIGGSAVVRAGDVGTGGNGGEAQLIGGETDDGGVGAQVLAAGGNVAVHGKVTIKSDNDRGSLGEGIVSDGAHHAVWGTVLTDPSAFDAAGVAAAAQSAAIAAAATDATTKANAAQAASQPHNVANLDPIALLTSTAYGRALLELANAAALIAAAGLDADLATLALPASTTISTFGASLIDDAAASNARTTLGLGTAAVANTGDFDAAGAAAAITAASLGAMTHAQVMMRTLGS